MYYQIMCILDHPNTMFCLFYFFFLTLRSKVFVKSMVNLDILHLNEEGRGKMNN